MATTAVGQNDPFRGASDRLNDPPRNGEAVDISALDYYPPSVTKRLYVGVAGDVTVMLPGGQILLFKGLPVGMHSIQAKAIMKTGTAATNMLALY